MGWYLRAALFAAWTVAGATAATAQSSDSPGAAAAAAAPAPVAADRPTVPAAPKSMMFTEQEIKDIEAAIADRGRGDDDSAPSAPHLVNVYVSAILNAGDGQWTVWANGVRLTPKLTQGPQFRVVAVRANAVEIVSTFPAERHVVLQANQTWRAVQNDIVEGLYP